MTSNTKKICAELAQQIAEARESGHAASLCALCMLTNAAHVRATADAEAMAKRALDAAQAESGHKAEVFNALGFANAFVVVGSPELIEAVARQAEVSQARANGAVRPLL